MTIVDATRPVTGGVKTHLDVSVAPGPVMGGVDTHLDLNVAAALDGIDEHADLCMNMRSGRMTAAYSLRQIRTSRELSWSGGESRAA